jgi:Domain of unknown function (DUF5615)
MTLQFTRIVVDENVPKEVVEWLKKMDFKEVYWILEKCPGITDPEVWRRAVVKKAVLLTGDIRYLPQLEQSDVLNGPDVIEYSTKGFDKSELQDPELMRLLLDWFFQNGHYLNKEHVKISINGHVQTRRQIWNEEQSRRKRQK